MYNKNTNETLDEYASRLYYEHYLGHLTIKEIAKLLEPYYAMKHTISKFKHDYIKFRDMLEETGSVDDNLSEEDEEVDEAQSLIETLREIKKERIKLSDERIQNNAILRRLSREDSIIEIANNFAKEMSNKKLLSIPNEIPYTE